MICFPVIRSIDIKGFQIYKNENNDGISHELNGGIHLIIGVNGLGKTTLLSALFRLLVGPKDIPKSDTALLGSTGHTLAQWRKNSFFRNRVKDGAINSFIKCKVSFGDNILEIERKLSNLEVVGLSKNGVILGKVRISRSFLPKLTR
ncbi:AAA family ATPase [Klebsiella electrica]|uniref:AAA family ATPase n=1 Tax=Klebsiella electrica TaxID=1259973 RepID=UPI003F7607AE